MSTSEEFWAAATTGDVEKVKELLAENRELANETKPAGVSVLMFTLYHGRLDTAQAIAVQKMNWNVFEAAAIGDSLMVSSMIAEDPSLISAFSADGFTALGLASYFGKFEAAKALVEAGADPNTLSNNDFHVAPIHSALAGGHINIVNLLLDNGANVNLAAGGGWTPLHYAADIGDADLTLRLLKMGANTGALTGDGQSAAEYGDQVGHGHISDIIRDFSD
ncbi:MAG: ankyrin repeat domain-containing protein [Fimbriimonadaceae bacterium]|nr:ankyrin repeat domain-containing protein [Fimbriimonadaceae bacterium]